MTEIVSAIIPVFNGADTIERAINTANFAMCDRILVYDDGSTDATIDVLNDLETKYKNLEVYADTHLYMHRGVNYARNTLCEIAGGGLIIPLDCDDELLDMKRLRDAWIPETWVYGDYQECGGGSVMKVKGAPSGSLYRREITGVTFMFHFDDWKRAGGYDSDFAFVEDYALQCALVNVGVRPQYVDTIVYNRHIKPSGNERTSLSRQYWGFYRDMARRKYPTVFAGTG